MAAIAGFDDAYVSLLSFFPKLVRAHAHRGKDRISKKNACGPNCLTPKKRKRSSPYTHTRNPSPRRPRRATPPCPPLGRSKRASKRPCCLPRLRLHRASRAWGGLRRPPRRARCRSRDDEDESVDTETEFGGCDFHDSGGVGWEGFGGEGVGVGVGTGTGGGGYYGGGGAKESG